MNVAIPPFHPNDVTVLDACAGFGMLGESVLAGLDVVGLRGRVICHVERDAAASAALVARMAASPVDQAPVWDDLATFDGRPWRGLVDIICAGLPCQPYSPAGKRRGNDDHRSFGDGGGPIPHFLRIINECRPAVVFCENVPAWVVGGHFRSVGGELCRMGYSLQEPIFLPARAVGAPHERERVFVMAYADCNELRAIVDRPFAGANWRHDAPGGGEGVPLADVKYDGGRSHFSGRRPNRGGTVGRAGKELADAGLGKLRRGDERGGIRGIQSAAQSEGDQRERTRGDSGSGECGLAADVGLADAGGQRREGTKRGNPLRTEGPPARGPTLQCDCELGNPERDGGEARTRDARQISGEEEGRAEGTELRRRVVPLFPPGRGDESDHDHPDWWAWAAVAAVDSSLMPRVEPELSMVADGLAFSRSDLLRIGGNGVVTLAAAVAFVALWNVAMRNVVEGSL